MIKTIILSFILFISFIQLSQATHSNESLTYSEQVNQLTADFVKLLYSTNPQEINSLTTISPQEKETILANIDQYKIEKIIDNQKQIYIQELNKLMKNGDNSATLALFDWLILNDRNNLHHTNIAPLQILAEKNDPQANFLMAQLYRNTDDYLKYLERSASAGYFTAQITLVDEYSFRLPENQQSGEKAKYWAQKAEENVGSKKYKEAMCHLANCDIEILK